MFKFGSNKDKDNNGRLPKSRILLPRKYVHPICVRVSGDDNDSDEKTEIQVLPPFRVGYGKTCEVQLPGSNGPDTLFEFAPIDDPLRVSTPKQKELLQHDYQILVDGKVQSESQLNLKAGSTVRLLDKAGHHQVEFTVDTPDSAHRRFNNIYVWLGLLSAILVGAGFYLASTLQTTEKRIDINETKISQTESKLQLHNQQFNNLLADFEVRQLEIENTVSELNELQDFRLESLRSEFNDGLRSITKNASERLSQLSEQDTQARAELSAATEGKIEQLKSDMSKTLIDSLEAFKRAQNELLFLNAKRLDALEIEGDKFKQVLAQSIDSIVFIKTTYVMTLSHSEETKSFDRLGTGFIVSESGRVITPQHVMKPWLYDEDLLAMQMFGLVAESPVSVAYTVWTAQERVLRAESNLTAYVTDNAFSSEGDDKRVELVYAPEPVRSIHQISSAFGIVEVLKPIPGPTDIAVVQLSGQGQVFKALSVSQQSADSIEPLDQVIVVGYPLSRLQDGQSIPQGVTGFVRRSGSQLLELDSALHPGSSGAPILNEKTEVIGMAIATIMSDSYGAAIPAARIIATMETGL